MIGMALADMGAIPIAVLISPATSNAALEAAFYSLKSIFSIYPASWLPIRVLRGQKRWRQQLL